MVIKIRQVEIPVGYEWWFSQNVDPAELSLLNTQAFSTKKEKKRAKTWETERKVEMGKKLAQGRTDDGKRVPDVPRTPHFTLSSLRSNTLIYPLPSLRLDRGKGSSHERVASFSRSTMGVCVCVGLPVQMHAEQIEVGGQFVSLSRKFISFWCTNLASFSSEDMRSHKSPLCSTQIGMSTALFKLLNADFCHLTAALYLLYFTFRIIYISITSQEFGLQE